MANVHSIARRNHVYIQVEVIEEWEEIKKDGVTPAEMARFDEKLRGAKAFAVVLDSAQQTKHALDRATSEEHLTDMFTLHQARVAALPDPPKAA